MCIAIIMALGGWLNTRRIAETMNHGQGFTANLVTAIIVRLVWRTVWHRKRNRTGAMEDNTVDLGGMDHHSSAGGVTGRSLLPRHKRLD